MPENNRKKNTPQIPEFEHASDLLAFIQQHSTLEDMMRTLWPNGLGEDGLNFSIEGCTSWVANQLLDLATDYISRNQSCRSMRIVFTQDGVPELYDTTDEKKPILLFRNGNQTELINTYGMKLDVEMEGRYSDYRIDGQGEAYLSLLRARIIETFRLQSGMSIIEGEDDLIIQR